VNIQKKKKENKKGKSKSALTSCAYVVCDFFFLPNQIKEIWSKLKSEAKVGEISCFLGAHIWGLDKKNSLNKNQKTFDSAFLFATSLSSQHKKALRRAQKRANQCGKCIAQCVQQPASSHYHTSPMAITTIPSKVQKKKKKLLAIN